MVKRYKEGLYLVVEVSTGDKIQVRLLHFFCSDVVEVYLKVKTPPPLKGIGDMASMEPVEFGIFSFM